MTEAPNLARRALERAESMRSPRAAEVLRRAVFLVHDSDAADWESSDGSVRAIDVRLLLDGTACALMSTFPGVHDAVVEAISAAAPEVLQASVIDITYAWALKEHHEEGYRDHHAERVDRRSPEDLRRALAAFLSAAGDDDAARDVERARMRFVDDAIHLAGIDRSRVHTALAVLVGKTD